MPRPWTYKEDPAPSGHPSAREPSQNPFTRPARPRYKTNDGRGPRSRPRAWRGRAWRHARGILRIRVFYFEIVCFSPTIFLFVLRCLVDHCWSTRQRRTNRKICIYSFAFKTNIFWHIAVVHKPVCLGTRKELPLKQTGSNRILDEGK